MGDNLGTTNIIDSIEKVLRYLIPGVAFSILFALSYPTYFDKAILKISASELLVFLVIFTIGISIYVIHSLIIKFTLEPLVYLLELSPVNLFSNDSCLCNYSKSHAELILNRKKSPNYPKEYYIYLWALLHYSFIMSWLLLFFSCFHEKFSWSATHSRFIAISGVLLLFFSICSYLCLQALEKNTTAIIIEKSNETSQQNTGVQNMNIKRHSILLTVCMSAWLFYFIIGLPSNYFIEWSLANQIILSMITFFSVIPVVVGILLLLLGGNYIKTALWVAFYASVPLFIIDYIIIGLIKGEGLKFLFSHWYLSIAYLYVWIEIPIIGLALKKLRNKSE